LTSSDLKVDHLTKTVRETELFLKNKKLDKESVGEKSQ